MEIYKGNLMMSENIVDDKISEILLETDRLLKDSFVHSIKMNSNNIQIVFPRKLKNRELRISRNYFSILS